MPIQNLRQLTPAESSSPVMLKCMKDFDEHTNKKYDESMIIPTDQYPSCNMYPAHDDEPSNTDSGYL